MAQPLLSDPPQQMTAAQVQKLRQWLNKKFPQGLSCPLCHETNRWRAGSMAVMPGFVGNRVQNTGPMLPVAQIICENCFHVVTFAAVPTGLLEPDDSQLESIQPPEKTSV